VSEWVNKESVATISACCTHNTKRRHGEVRRRNQIFQRFLVLPSVEINGSNMLIMSFNFNFATRWAAITAFTCCHVICS
jgi:hypothetical protein